MPRWDNGSVYAYSGEKCPGWCPLEIWEGWLDFVRLYKFQSLYRRPKWKQYLYRVGWLTAKLFPSIKRRKKLFFGGNHD